MPLCLRLCWLLALVESPAGQGVGSVTSITQRSFRFKRSPRVEIVRFGHIICFVSSTAPGLVPGPGPGARRAMRDDLITIPPGRRAAGPMRHLTMYLHEPEEYRTEQRFNTNEAMQHTKSGWPFQGIFVPQARDCELGCRAPASLLVLGRVPRGTQSTCAKYYTSGTLPYGLHVPLILLVHVHDASLSFYGAILLGTWYSPDSPLA